VQVSEPILKHLFADKKLSYSDRSLYLWVVHFHPESLRELAIRTGFSRDCRMPPP
jgi:hypothetical protein